MARIKVGTGRVSVEIGPELDRAIRSILTGAESGLEGEIEALVDKVRDDARAVWYDQVDERTGRSRESIEAELRVSPSAITGVVFATQKATYMIRRPGALSLKSTNRLADPSQYADLMSTFRETGRLPPGYIAERVEDGRPTAIRREYVNPKASDGKNMWNENVLKPGRKLIRDKRKQIEKAVQASAARRTARG